MQKFLLVTHPIAARYITRYSQLNSHTCGQRMDDVMKQRTLTNGTSSDFYMARRPGDEK